MRNFVCLLVLALPAEVFADMEAEARAQAEVQVAVLRGRANCASGKKCEACNPAVCSGDSCANGTCVVSQYHLSPAPSPMPVRTVVTSTPTTVSYEFVPAQAPAPIQTIVPNETRAVYYTEVRPQFQPQPVPVQSFRYVTPAPVQYYSAPPTYVREAPRRSVTTFSSGCPNGQCPNR